VNVRDEITVERVAEMYFSGMSMMRIAEFFNADVDTIKNRIKRGRKTLKHLDWEGRRPVRHQGAGREYSRMVDGTPGARDFPAASGVSDDVIQSFRDSREL
jgi:hypothetical protein